MASINYASKEISCKIVFYGPGLSGKTTNLQYVHLKIPAQSRGELISLATDQDRTLYFDFLPLDIGKIHGFSTKFQLYTVPGQVYYNATRKLVLRGVDGLVFVADSQRSKMDENLESLQNLADNLGEYEYSMDKIPLVFQYNKRDLSTLNSVEELERTLNPKGHPHFESVATKGVGVFDTLKCISKLVLDQAKRKELFSDRKTEAGEADRISAARTQSSVATAGQATAAVDVSPPVAASTGGPQTTVVEEVPEPVAESTRAPKGGPQGNEPEVGLDVEEIPQKRTIPAVQPSRQESPTVISWSAGKSGKRVKGRGFFLWRMLNKLLNR
jgi:signal recognition particle receptor subunit beta